MANNIIGGTRRRGGPEYPHESQSERSLEQRGSACSNLAPLEYRGRFTSKLEARNRKELNASLEREKVGIICVSVNARVAVKTKERLGEICTRDLRLCNVANFGTSIVQSSPDTPTAKKKSIIRQLERTLPSSSAFMGALFHRCLFEAIFKKP
jgi:hypothetical protein